MLPEVKRPELIWQEDSAIWEIVAGELVVQHTDPVSGDPAALMRRAREHVADAIERLRSDDKDSAGHTLIGCAVALGLAARAQSENESPIERYASELAAGISWQAHEPSIEELNEVLGLLDSSGDVPVAELPTLWEVATRAGACAAGLSSFISRRRQRRDLV